MGQLLKLSHKMEVVKATPRAAQRFARALLGLGFLLVRLLALADGRPPPPGEFIALSENGRFVARVIPAGKYSKLMVIVLAIQNHRTNEVWRADLCNLVAPMEVFVGDEGTNIVTLDNWGRFGYGAEVVAIYGPEGLRAKYSLEEFAPPTRSPPSAPRGSAANLENAYRKRFSHSSASRFWRRNSIQFFMREADEVRFCLWLDWDERWVVWRMRDGKLLELTQDETAHCNAEGRRRVLQLGKGDELPPLAWKILAGLRPAEDRPLFQAGLESSEFVTTVGWNQFSGQTNDSFGFVAYSPKRLETEGILSRWDGRVISDCPKTGPENYHYLGVVEGCLSLNSGPRREDGILRLYLIPMSVSLTDWSKCGPQHYLIVDLNHNPAVKFEVREGEVPRLAVLIRFRICGVTPGEYRLKAVWNKTPPFTSSDTIVSPPHAGDYESVSSPLFSVTAGMLTEGLQIECATPGGN